MMPHIRSGDGATRNCQQGARKWCALHVVPSWSTTRGLEPLALNALSVIVVSAGGRAPADEHVTRSARFVGAFEHESGLESLVGEQTQPVATDPSTASRVQTCRRERRLGELVRSVGEAAPAGTGHRRGMAMHVRSGSARILLTGASRGIGREAAIQLARLGHRVVLAARDTEALGALSTEIRAAGGQAEVLPVDVTDPAAAERAVAQVLAAGPCDVLVNNPSWRPRSMSSVHVSTSAPYA